MWIARDENGDLNLFRIKPYKSVGGYWIADIENPQNHKMRIDRNLFAYVTHRTEPIEVVVCPDVSSGQFEEKVSGEMIHINGEHSESENTEINWDDIPHPQTFNVEELKLWALSSLVKMYPTIKTKEIARNLGFDVRSLHRFLVSHSFSGIKQFKESILNKTENDN